MRTLIKTIRTATVEKKNWKQAMYVFLRQYRATPHTTTNLSPSEALNIRKLKIPLPQLSETEDDASIRRSETKKKKMMKEYADRKQHAKHNKIEIGDKVLISQQKTNKLTTPFNPKPLIALSKKGSMITAKRGDKRVTRNVSFF